MLHCLLLLKQLLWVDIRLAQATARNALVDQCGTFSGGHGQNSVCLSLFLFQKIGEDAVIVLQQVGDKQTRSTVLDGQFSFVLRAKGSATDRQRQLGPVNVVVFSLRLCVVNEAIVSATNRFDALLPVLDRSVDSEKVAGTQATQNRCHGTLGVTLLVGTNYCQLDSNKCLPEG